MEEIVDEIVFDVSSPSDNAQVIYAARQMLEQMGFDETRQFLIASAVSELSTNIIRYAKRGSIKFEIFQQGDKRAFVVIARDFGPGIVDVHQALKEHYSTGNGLGLGLPSVKRIMDDFEIRSIPGRETCITARKWIVDQCRK